MAPVTLEEAAQRLPELVSAVTSGEEVTLTRNGHPVAKLVAVPPSASPQALRPLDTAKGLIVVPDDFKAPLEDFAVYM